MENEQIDPFETNGVQSVRETEHLTPNESASNEAIPQVQPEESVAVEEDLDSIDESRDTSSRTSTRLVKFQLFETKAVLSLVQQGLTTALLYPRIQSK
jgi:hypothetical protein